ncbi:4-(cytidine 5'-diphospho)-2-C-methyl-D-erythritol kinase [Desulfosarcina ovata]|uniref:4-diphosphocytidyl-2-C-methyl-D-erythritol kinase n=2 Tax=Desulfosarcina ovata TaxID=83564 RepID=A0A5K8AJ56_9BACT|nr:4-(cytidine 5'-diphospho)-2-C-methyl-D-erythritol kinase [Desulfosarcina ovata]BBO85504.1 4-diphosphocytidyl-2-C-methyl-D-erythritol kinase [Desulfosarcina ovata subsp. sediminis]BBO92539.1 4-diphosphocytidyl-2-C-methyl-D-erythritol kinase [Desulfosarcina ovata subsp. ovata]
MTVTVHAPAKINLFLRITGKRSDGYHELSSVMCPVALYDTVTITFGDDDGIQVACAHPAVPEDSSNLVARAAALFFETAFAGCPPLGGGMRIHIEKRIPVGAGLGGGSSDAAAVLVALNRHFGLPLTHTTLQAVGARIGADVPFFIFGAPALATGIGEQLAAFPYLAPWTALLVYPGVAISTAWVYKNLNLRLTKDEKKLSKFHFNGRFFRLDEHLVNDLEPVTESAFPVITEIKRLLQAHGAKGAMMSGSGSAVFGLYADRDRAESAYKVLCGNQQRQNWTLYIADLLI